MPFQSRFGDKSQVPSDSHGSPCCAHSAIGPAITGSPNVLVNGKQALRIGDTGQHSSCCGAQTWIASAGSGTVLINEMGAHRMGDQDQHCGGVGAMVEASTDVTVGG